MMIQANELRYGNWVKSTVTGEVITVNWLVIKHVANGNVQSVYDVDMPVYTPIPLTPELLERCGFEYRHDRGQVYDWHIGENPVTYDWLFCITEFREDKIFFYQNGHHQIKSLHHLMNLYHSLTGTELEVKW